MQTTTITNAVKFGFYNAKPLLTAYENDIVYEDMPQFPNDAQYKSTLAHLRQSPAAARRIEAVVDEAARLAKDEENVLPRCSGDTYNAASSALYMMHIELAIEKSMSVTEYVVAAYVLTRLRSHLGRTLFNSAGLALFRTLLLDNLRETANLAAQQQDFLM